MDRLLNLKGRTRTVVYTAIMAVLGLFLPFIIVMLAVDKEEFASGTPLTQPWIDWVPALFILWIILLSAFLFLPRPDFTWRRNLARFPRLREAIERYRKPDEAAHKFLPAFVIEGKRYFLVLYVPKAEERTAQVEVASLVLDEEGDICPDEKLHEQLVRYHYFLSRAAPFFAAEIQKRHKEMKAARKTVQAHRRIHSFIHSKLLPRLEGEIRTTVGKMIDDTFENMKALCSGLEREHEWAENLEIKLEYHPEDIEKHLEVRRGIDRRLEAIAPSLLANWEKLQRMKLAIEKHIKASSSEQRLWVASWRAFEIAVDNAEFTITHDGGIDPKRVDVFRKRTAYALSLDREGDGAQELA